MKEIEKELLKYNNLKSDLISIARYIDCCEEKDICFYQDLAITYSERLKKLHEFIQTEYGISSCCNKCMQQETNKPAN
ncbi:hypothetical protein [Bacillus paramycoides]|uniref:hypothetical protein n=1 Tax=Bacillus paramycoides TaxID=2026194 RepID=UPI002E233685|nr:hypothetical protein [Bacillus paramycoides]